MSVVFNIDEIDTETKRELCKELTLIPIDQYQESMKKWRKPAQRNYSAPAVPVLMFDVDIENRTVKFPFYVAMERMGVKPNRHKEFPKVTKKGKLDFKAELREYQVEPAAEALEQLKEHCTTTIGLPPGWGKTIVGAYLAGKANGPIIVFAHRMKICEAWEKTFQLCYPQYAKSIWIVGKNDWEQGVPIPKNCTNQDGEKCCDSDLDEEDWCKDCKAEDKYVPIFTICMDTRIDKVPQYIKDAICVTIIDEAHLFCTPSRVKCVLATQPKFVIAESATLYRKNRMEKMIQKVVGEHGVFEINNKPYRLFIIDTKVEVDIVKGKRGTDFTDLTKKLVHHEDRNHIILNCIKCNMHRKIMILCRQKDHVEILFKLLQDNDIEVSTLYGSQEEYKDSHVLIGTIPKMGTGFDEKNACSDFKGRESDLLFLVTSIAISEIDGSEIGDVSLFEQCKGRGMRSSDPAIFYFRDNLDIVKRHIRCVLDWVEMTKGTVIKLPYKEDEMFIPDVEYDSDNEMTEVETRNPYKKKSKITIKINKKSEN